MTYKQEGESGKWEARRSGKEGKEKEAGIVEDLVIVSDILRETASTKPILLYN